jgi:hypothetical protein
MKTLACILLWCVAAPVMGGASPDGPATRPADAAPIAELSPKGWLHAYNDAMRTGDPKALRDRVAAGSDDARTLADAMVAHDAAVGAALKAASAKFDEKTVAVIGHALNDMGNLDLQDATITRTGDHATVSVRGLTGTPLVLQNGKWKIDVDKMTADYGNQPGAIDAIVQSYEHDSAAATDLTKAFKDGEVKTVDDAVAIVRRRMME